MVEDDPFCCYLIFNCQAPGAVAGNKNDKEYFGLCHFWKWHSYSG
ncbi:MAG: hypothetical protein K0S47_4609 [Herbinix sp.]|jgi:hypothetical protein|nr:hypothetical protein [Herbinix sp.]MDF2988481.1 hypothetical protein [Eubacterium sp.]